MNEENLSYLIPQLVDKYHKLEKEVRITRNILWFIAGMVVAELVLKII